MHFACFRCAGRIVRMTKSIIPKPTSGHLKRSFFLGVQRSDQKFHFQVSRGRIRILTFRCPEVGLEISLLGVQRSDYNFHFQVSRGRFNIFTFRCPEVGLELSLLVSRGQIQNSRSRCGCGADSDLEISCPRSASGVRFRNSKFDFKNS